MFRKLKNLITYCRTIKKNINNLRTHFILNSENKPYEIIDMDIDNAYRIYTVINFKPQTQEDLKKYGYYYMDNEVKNFIREMNIELKKIGLFEFIGLSRADQIDDNSVWIVMEYRFLKTTKVIRNSIMILSSLLLSSILFFTLY